MEKQLDLKRIYRQAEKGSNELLEILNSYPHINKRNFEVFGITNEIEFESIDRLKDFQKKVEIELKKRCKLLEPYYCLPILMDFISKFYENYGNFGSLDKQNFGMPAKLIIALVWDNIDNPKSSDGKSYSEIGDAIFVATFYLQIDYLLRHWDIYELDEVSIIENGLKGINLNKLNIDLINQGRHEYKTLPFSLSEIWRNPNEFILKVHFLTSSTKESPKRLFPNSVLGEITSLDFWFSLWATILILQMCIDERTKSNSHQSVYGIALLNKSYLLKRTDFVDEYKIQQAIEENFWQRKWYDKSLKEGLRVLSDKIIRRPALRILGSENVFVTSYLFLEDSINLKIEEYLLSQQGSQLFEKYLSKPFEVKVIELFRNYGFKAGEVSEKGAWLTQYGSEELNKGTKKHGQIDLLANNDDEAIIADCKVLHFPYSNNKLRNLINKIGDIDEECFHSKLNKKAQWVIASKAIKTANFIKLLIVDRFIPLGLLSKNIVLTIDQVEECLKLNLSVNSWKSFWVNKIYGDK